MERHFQPDEFLRAQLRGPIRLTGARRATFGPGIAAQDEIVTTNRLILVLKGRLNYRMEDQTFRFQTGTQFFVPAWIRRFSRVASREQCEAIWCEFDLEETGPEVALLCHRKLDPASLRLEKRAHQILADLFSRPTDRLHELRQEAEVKAMLGRFWTEAAPPRQPSSPPASPIHPSVKSALRWLGEHFREPHALRDLYHHAGVSPNYLRRQFQVGLSCHPGSYLQRLRLREARYLLRTTDLPQKQIAALVGYSDPLYFSRLYRSFWRHAPGAERK